jgi:catechol 2,3-dioxygenase-like lactoylglutathione lyase family enzyme
MDYKLELIAVPVSDIDRAKDFYVNKVGFNADHDHQFNEEIRFVQLTPPGSGCSIAMATGPYAAKMEPGSVDGLCLVVEDANAVHDELAGRGVEVSDDQDLPWGRFVFFADPDGNRWSIQQIQYPGRPIP